MMSRCINLTWWLSELSENHGRSEGGNNWEIDTAIVDGDSISFRVVDRLEAKSNDRPGPKTCDLPEILIKRVVGNAKYSPD